MADRLVPLPLEHRQLLEEDHQRSMRAMAEIGQAYLELINARARFEQAGKRLQECEMQARLAKELQEKSFFKVATTLGLPPGQWTFDATGGILVSELPEQPEGETDG